MQCRFREREIGSKTRNIDNEREGLLRNMIDDRLDSRLMDLNRRYQEVLYSEQAERKRKKNRYIGYIMTGNLEQLVEDLKYRRYSRKNCSVMGNVSHPQQYNEANAGARITVYSSIIGRYDEIIEPVYKEEGVRYLMFTDQEVPSGSAWEKVDVTGLPEYNTMTPIQLNRKIKMLPNQYILDADYSIYVDGNIEIVAGVSPIICSMGEAGFGVHYHASRDCIYDEAVAVLHYKRANKDEVRVQMDEYKKNGFPAHYGLFENSILVRKHNDKSVKELMCAWWEEYNKYPTRDQFSLPYVVWKTGFDAERIAILGNNINRNPRFNRVQKHIG